MCIAHADQYVAAAHGTYTQTENIIEICNIIYAFIGIFLRIITSYVGQS